MRTTIKLQGLFLLGSILILLGAVNPGVGLAMESHPVTVTIPEICRYRVEDSSIRPAGSNRVIQEVAVAILSNSQRTWQLLAVVDGNRQGIEWSENGQIWHPLANEGSTLLSGSRVSWQIYRLYFRYQPATPTFQVNYQLLLAD